METFSTLRALCAGNSPVAGEFPSQGPWTRSFDVFFIYAWKNSWVNKREAGDLKHHRVHYDVIVMEVIWCWQVIDSIPKLEVGTQFVLSETYRCVVPWQYWIASHVWFSTYLIYTATLSADCVRKHRTFSYRYSNDTTRWKIPRKHEDPCITYSQ